MRLLKLIGCVGLAALVCQVSLAEESNQGEVRAGIEEGGWHIAYGRMVTEAEYAQLAASIAASVASGNPGPVLGYLEDFAATTVDKVAGQVPGIGHDVLLENLKKAITSPTHNLSLGRVDFKFGVATYNRWQRVVYDVPEVHMVKKEKRVLGHRVVYHEPETVMVRHENHVPLPNWHQPYVGIRVH